MKEIWYNVVFILAYDVSEAFLMNINKPFILTPEIEPRLQNFILFEPASSRIQDVDILMRGEEIVDFYERLNEQLLDSNDLKTQILLNRTSKIGQMLDLLGSYDNVIMTKFLDRIWRRYIYISNIGESFLDLPNFLKFFPEFNDNKEDIISLRIDEDDDEPESDDDNDDSDDDDDNEKDDKNSDE